MACGIQPGWELITINGNQINDFFDLQYNSSDYHLDCVFVDHLSEQRRITIIREGTKPLGLEPVDYPCRQCHNNCIFCFIDQMPPGLRNTLYIKDDDYLYSYVFGNYITLTNMTDADFERIIDQHISPLYISIHTLDAKLRKQIMRYKQDFDIENKLRQLLNKGIKLHIQIVMVPGFNDGDQLSKTLTTLLQMQEGLLSIGIVPVGLTRFRNNLSTLRPVDHNTALETIEMVNTLRSQYASDLIFCADEFYIQAGQDIPQADHYKDYPQIENGIGMIRLMLENFKRKKRTFIKELRKTARPLLFLTSKSAYSYIKDLGEYLNSKLEHDFIRIQAIENHFFGESITVSGLLTFIDIRDQIAPLENEVIVFPNNVFNHEGLTLDGFSQIEIKEQLNRDILIVDHLFEDWDWI